MRQRGAETIDHPGGTLYAHLSRVHDRLGRLLNTRIVATYTYEACRAWSSRVLGLRLASRRCC
ncbi:DUF6817 domain-containing protein [Dactylosporangium roseum]|uniref:DUF6817 domain-containing protein n=1 Tax=Dactylosporangium roseum TaxID=47989 RepID=UPI0031E0F52C